MVRVSRHRIRAGSQSLSLSLLLLLLSFPLSLYCCLIPDVIRIQAALQFGHRMQSLQNTKRSGLSCVTQLASQAQSAYLGSSSSGSKCCTVGPATAHAGRQHTA